MAKIASDMNKPDGLFVIMPDKVQHFIESLPIQKVPGVGKTSFKHLEQIGIQTLGDVKKYPEKMLMKRLGKFGQRLIELSKGIDNSPVEPYAKRKSISREETLREDTREKKLLSKYLLRQAEKVGRDLRRLGVKGKTVTLKIKRSDFKQVTRRTTIDIPTQSSKVIYIEAKKLLDAYKILKKIRLIGLGVSGLVSDDLPIQMDLFSNNKKKNTSWEKVDRAVDTITKKYGKDVITRATLK